MFSELFTKNHCYEKNHPEPKSSVTFITKVGTGIFWLSKYWLSNLDKFRQFRLGEIC